MRIPQKAHSAGLLIALALCERRALAQAANEPAAGAPPAATSAAPADVTPSAAAPTPAAPDASANDPAAELRQMRAELAEQKRQLEALKAKEEATATEAAAAAEPTPEDTEPQKFSIYGFMDMGFQRTWADPKSPVSNFLNSNASTFVLGNLNMYLDAQPVKHWRGLMEIRFTNAPLGNVESVGGFGQTFKRTTTEQIDPNGASLNAPMWGGYTVIERAHIDWTPRQEFNIRAGYFFTPFGIWNVDHGSPTLISTFLPQLVVDKLFPIRQTGLMLFGSTLTGPWELGYMATLTNGRQELSAYDFDDDKAFGGRLYARCDCDIRSQFGLSFYEGDNNDKVVTLTQVSPLKFQNSESFRYKEWSLGADVSLDMGPTRFRAEGLIRRVKYDVGKRQPSSPLFAPGGFLPDSYTSTAYALLAHQLPWGGLEPLVFGEILHGPISVGDTVVQYSAGLNVHFTPATQLKMQVARSHFFNVRANGPSDPARNDDTTLFTRLVLAY
jgi:hypothetical protein